MIHKPVVKHFIVFIVLAGAIVTNKYSCAGVPLISNLPPLHMVQQYIVEHLPTALQGGIDLPILYIVLSSTVPCNDVDSVYWISEK